MIVLGRSRLWMDERMRMEISLVSPVEGLRCQAKWRERDDGDSSAEAIFHGLWVLL